MMGQVQRSQTYPLFYRMPDGPGHYFGRAAVGRLYGQAFLIMFLMELSSAWVGKHPGHPFGIGDIAEPTGKPMPDHVSHNYGSAVDLFVIHQLGIKRNDTANKVTWKDPGYDSDKTGDLIALIAELSEKCRLQQFLYNDPELQKLKKNWPPIQTHAGHDEHIHLTFTGKHSFPKAQMDSIFN